MGSQLLRTKSIDKLVAESEDPLHRLRKSPGPWSLTALGLGAAIGAGIFVLSGTAVVGETLQVESLLHAPLLSVILHGSEAGGMSGGPARVLPLSFPSFSPPSLVVWQLFAMRSWPPGFPLPAALTHTPMPRALGARAALRLPYLDGQLACAEVAAFLCMARRGAGHILGLQPPA